MAARRPKRATAAGATHLARPAPPTTPARSCRRSASGSRAADRGLSYLRAAQRPGGGFPLGGSGAVNSQSTAWAIQGILAAGGDPGRFRRGGASAPDYLSAQQASDGHYRYSGSSNQTPIWVTGEVLVAAAGKSFPVPVAPQAPQPAPKPSSKAGSADDEPELLGSAGEPDPPSALAGWLADRPRSPRAVGPVPLGGQGVPGIPPGKEPRARLHPDGAVHHDALVRESPGNRRPLLAVWPPILIGVATGGLALGTTWWLARRHGW